MRLKHSPIADWLSLRIRIACVGVFVISLFLPPYAPNTSFAAADIAYDDYQYLFVEEGFLMKTSSLTERGSRRAYAEGIIHIVEENESVPSIAQFYDLKTETVLWANNLKKGDVIQPKDELLILPVDGIVHKVKRGQNLLRIAELYEISIEDIKERNKIKGGYLLAGQELIIPGGRPIIEKLTVIAQKPPEVQIPTPTAPRKLDEKPPSVRRQLYEPPPSVGVLQKPCSCFYTQYFNGRHFAVDMQQKGGGPIFAAEGGTVIRADYGWNGGYGNVIEIDHGNGLVTLYAHNKALQVSKGETVNRGQFIADMGNSGLVYGPTGVHVHFEVRVNGFKKNPILYLQ